MAIHNAWGRFLPTKDGNVIPRTVDGGTGDVTNGSIDLTKGQLGLFNTKKVTTNGLEPLDPTAVGNLTAKDELEVHVGTKDVGLTRSRGNKSKKTRRFKVANVKGLSKFDPDATQKVDKLNVGYNGADAETALDFTDVPVGGTELMSIKMDGGIIGLLGYDHACAYVNVHFEKEYDGQTNLEIVQNAVDALKRDTLKENIPVVGNDDTNGDPQQGAIKVSVENPSGDLVSILIEGKTVEQVPPEHLIAEVPFINTSTRVEVSGGFRSSNFVSFQEGSGDRFAVQLLERAADLTNLGGELKALEDIDFNYFNGYSRYTDVEGRQSEFAKTMRGEESVLDFAAQYITYILSIEHNSFSQGFSGKLSENFDYIIAVKKGDQADVEALLNALATKVGLETV